MTVIYTPRHKTPETYTKIKKDVVDKAIEVGTMKGYTPLNYDYEKGVVVLESSFLDRKYRMTVTCVVTPNGELVAHIYAPLESPGGQTAITDMHDALLNLYK